MGQFLCMKSFEVLEHYSSLDGNLSGQVSPPCSTLYFNLTSSSLLVVFASWDAEEVVLILDLLLPDIDIMPQYGLVGSTEWAEDFSTWISRHAVAYLNTDTSSSGSRWNVGGSPSLAHLIKRSALDVPHPSTEGKTLWDARTDEGPFTRDDMIVDAKIMSAYVAAKKEIQASDTSIHPLGSGSDYTVFLQRLGVRCHASFMVISLLC